MSEIRVLLLTDVVDSTRLSASMGDLATAELWVAHDRIARDLLQRHQGREIDKSDGMLLLFEGVDQAIAYALEYHRALESLPVPLSARAGIHLGPVILRENSPEDIARGAKPLEVDGIAKPTAARVMSLARGRQTLLSAEARRALVDAALKVRSHGHWAVKGIDAPLELFEVADHDDAFMLPGDGDKGYRVVRSGERWLPVAQVPNNLPQQTTSFIGREREIDEVRAHLGSARLLTLLGMGGLGKTRLSLQVAAEVMAHHPDGVWFLDLAPIRDPALVPAEAAQVLGLREEPDRPLLDTLCAHLKALRVLLVFDNCEHLVRPAADLAHALLRAAPGVSILASSRAVLRVPGEQVYPVLPLPVPNRGDALEALARSTAVRLFVERAQLHKPSFTLNAREAPAVAELVARLEGIPLAIELAAARVRSLAVADINARLKDRYKVLTGGARVLELRQQTLRALVDWSYELLDASERKVLDRLGVFAGGFALAAAEQVCGVEPIAPDDVVELLGSLVEKSLVTFDETEEGGRYRMLETLRDYAREKLEVAGETAAAVARHCDHYFALAKEANRGLQGARQAEWIVRLESELDNLRAAMALALGGGADPLIAVKLAVALQNFWILRGYATEGRGLVRAALALPAIRDSDRGQAFALYVGAALAGSQSDHAESLQMLEACLVLRRRLDSPVEVAATLSTLSVSQLQEGDAIGAQRSEREALDLFRGLGDRFGEAIGLLHLGQIALHSGDFGVAAADLKAGLAVAHAIANQEIEGECERVLGELALETGDLEQASLRFKRSLTVCREAGDRHGEANALRWLGRSDVERGDLVAGRRRLAEALRTFRAFEMRDELLGCLEDHAVLARLQSDVGRAIRLSAAVDGSRERLGLARAPRLEQRWKAHVEALRAALTGSAFDEAWLAGRGLELDETLRIAVEPGLEAVAA